MRSNPILFSSLLVGLNTTFIANSYALGWHHGISLGLNHYNSDARIEFYNQQTQQLDSISANFKADTTSQILDNQLSLSGYSTNHFWFMDYKINQYSLEDKPTQDTSYNLKGFNAQWLAGYKVAQLHANTRLYAMAGLNYHKQEFSYPNSLSGQNKHSDSTTNTLLGFRLDIPFNRDWVAHIKGNTKLTGSQKSTKAAIALNYRFSRDFTLLAEYQRQSLKTTKADSSSTSFYQFDGNINQISLKTTLIW